MPPPAGAAGERLDEIRLAVSEALTNAVVHAYRNGEAGRLHVTAAVASDELWVLIGDDGRGLHAWNDSRGLGIGLSLISGLSDDFAIVTRASGGTEVQMRFDLRKSGLRAARGQSRGSCLLSDLSGLISLLHDDVAGPRRDHGLDVVPARDRGPPRTASGATGPLRIRGRSAR